jgi:hypothetical protein
VIESIELGLTLGTRAGTIGSLSVLGDGLPTEPGSDGERRDTHFGLPLAVIAQPTEWYSYHREPKIVEWRKDRARVLVRFTAESFSGEEFGGTYLYACRDGHWGAYRIKPSESQDIASAEAWLVKRKWRGW